MTLQDAIKGMMNFYRAVEKVYTDLPERVKIAEEVKGKFADCLFEASDAMDELEKMRTVGVDCGHCKFYNAPDCNACKECMFFWLAPTNQKRPLNYEPI